MEPIIISPEIIGALASLALVVGAALMRGAVQALKKLVGEPEKGDVDATGGVLHGADTPTVMSRLAALLSTMEGLRDDIKELRRKLDDEVEEASRFRGSTDERLKGIDVRVKSLEDRTTVLETRTLNLYNARGMTPRISETLTPPETSAPRGKI